MPTTYATWNPSDKHADITLSNGNLTATNSGSWRAVRATQGKSSGKWYWEITLTDVTYMNFGVMMALAALTSYPGFDQYGAGFDRATLYCGAQFTPNGSGGIDPTAGQIVSVAVDFDAGKAWFGVAGTWMRSGNPAAGTNWCVGFTPGATLYPAVGVQTANCTANFGASAFAYTVPSGFNSGWYTAPQTFEVDIAAASGMNAAMSALHLVDAITANAGIEAAFDGRLLRDDLDGALGIQAAFSASGSDYSTAVSAGAGVRSEMAGYRLSDSLPAAAGLGMTLSRAVEAQRNMTAAAGVLVDFDGFNWSDFLRTYRDRITIRYILTLSDGVLDEIEIPISSFQGRFRTGDPTFLSVVVPGSDLYDAIAARDEGELLLTMQYLVDGAVCHEEELCAVDLEAIRIDAGASSVSVTLSGHRTVTHAAKTTQLTGASYRAVYDGKIRCRCTPDLYLRPGDTVTVGDDTFTAGVVVWTVNPTFQTMEVEEA